ncbi:hypothetical protein Goari_015092, partial [Gossypium aridum]|nr:hypothetical protein [Gossypium aridum]
IHTANPYVSSHQRFVLTGVKVGLDTTTDPVGPSSYIKSPSIEKTSETKSDSMSKRDAPMSFISECNEVPPSNIGVENSVPTKVSYGGGSTAGSIQSWHMDDFFGLTGLNQSFGYMDNELSKVLNLPDHSLTIYEPALTRVADSGKHGDSDGSPFLRPAEEEVFDDEYMGQVPESHWAVPQVPSPPTASGLYWPKDSHNQSDSTVFVPDISWSSMENPFH